MPDQPLPPEDLAFRVGVVDASDPVASFDAMGASQREFVVNLLGADWLAAGGRRVLDFGCGAGKLLRHLLPEAQANEFYGCDIHEPSIRWLAEHHSPPLTVFTVTEEPGIDLPSEHVDAALAMSVFTHLTDTWAGWLLEIHRVLRPGGRFICTYLGEHMSEAIAGEPWDPDRVGMNVLRVWQSWDEGGPSVQHSEWWLRAHWGRLFEFELVDDSVEGAHGVLVLRKRDVRLTEEELKAFERDEPRELTALAHNVEQLAAESYALGTDRRAVTRHRDDVVADRDLIIAQLEATRVERDGLAELVRARRAPAGPARKLLGALRRRA